MLKTSMLMRGKPFREWIAVYYDPGRITEEQLQSILRERRCPRARLDRQEGQPLTVMNPCVGAGDLVQLRVAARSESRIKRVELPADWKLVGEPAGSRGAGGVTFFTVRVSPKAKQGKQRVVLHPEKGDALEAEVEVVRKIGD